MREQIRYIHFRNVGCGTTSRAFMALLIRGHKKRDMSDDDGDNLVQKRSGLWPNGRRAVPPAGARRGHSVRGQVAAGFTKIKGKHVVVDGLVSRDGNRRILPESHDYEWIDLKRSACKGLLARCSGPSSTGIRGVSNRTAARRHKNSGADAGRETRGLADENYKDLERAKVQVMKAFKRKAPETANEPSCPTCGRKYDRDNWAACKRGYNLVSMYGRPSHIHEVHSECLPPAYKAKLLAARSGDPFGGHIPIARKKIMTAGG